MRKRLIYLALIMALAVLAVQLSTLVRTSQSTGVLVNDTIEYWGAARLLWAGENPYAETALFAMQQEAGWDEPDALMMWNPPWVLLFVLPLGALSYTGAALLWLAVNIVLFLLCADRLWCMYGVPIQRRWLAALVGLTFFPSILALVLGQISILMLVGLVGFLHFGERKQWIWAGAAGVLIAIKPQLLYLFWIVLVLWALHRRQWTVLLGGGVAGLIATALPLALNPALLGHYVDASLNHPPLDWVTPTLGGILRLFMGQEQIWLQFTPSVLGGLWGIWYWWRHRGTWHWPDRLPLLLLVSLFTTSYGWTYDYVLLLPAIMQVVGWAFQGKLSTSSRSLLLGYTGVNLLMLILRSDLVGLSLDFWYAWFLPLMLLVYVWLSQQVIRLPDHAAAPGR